jgi:acyl carrier protein
LSPEDFEELQAIVAEELGIPFEDLRTTTELVGDSLTLTEIIVRVETEFSILISDEESSKVKTFMDLHSLVESKR